MQSAKERAPQFDLPSTSGGRRTVESYRGKKLVLYFYPKDETPGCTREACDFRDNLARLASIGVAVAGVSKDSIEQHHRFRDNHRLNFELLSDEDNSVARAYGAFGLKKLYGKVSQGTIRTTVLIDENGYVERRWSPVKVDGHVAQVLAALGDSAPAGASRRTPARAKPKPKAKAKAKATKKTSAGRKPARKK